MPTVLVITVIRPSGAQVNRHHLNALMFEFLVCNKQSAPGEVLASLAISFQSHHLGLFQLELVRDGVRRFEDVFGR